MKEIQVLDKTFVPYIQQEELDQLVAQMAEKIHQDYQDEIPVFIGVLNGVVIFFSDFLKKYPGACEIAFMQLSSYKGTQSTGKVKTVMEIPVDITDRHVILFEDIVDTGNTLEKLYDYMASKAVKSLKIASLFLKPEVYDKDLPLDYVGKEIPNKFVLGYGLDYDGLGRNLPDLYQIKEEK